MAKDKVLHKAIKTLPQIYAFGEVLNLHQAMAKDKVLHKASHTISHLILHSLKQ